MSNLSLRCARCENTQSPRDARFCVACGYALRQECPYDNCAGQNIVVLRASPAHGPQPLCGDCGRFLLFCPNCYRLHRLNERSCRTRRCRDSGHAPREYFASCHSRFGGGAGFVEVPWPWKSEEVKELDGDLWQGLADEEGKVASSGICGLAYRYGQLVALRSQDGLMTHFTRWRRSLRNLNATQPFVLESSSLSAGADLFPHPYALALAHGHAYVLATGGAFRFSLGREAESDTPNAPLHSERLTWDEWNSGAQSHDFWLEDAAQEKETIADGVQGIAMEVEAWGDWNQSTLESVIPGATSGGAEEWSGSPQGTGESTSLPDLSHIEWRLQAATSEQWLALGESNGDPVALACDGFNAQFAAHRINPPPLKVDDWRDLLAWGDNIVLVAEKELWIEKQGIWSQLWVCPTDSAGLTLRGVVPWDEKVIVWGEGNNGVWVRLINRQGLTEPAFWVGGSAGSQRVYPSPVRLNSRLYFFASANESHQILAIDMAQPLVKVDAITLRSNTSCVWALGAACDSGKFLAYALDDGLDVEFYIHSISAQSGENASSLIEKLRPVRGVGSTLAATVADGRLAFGALTQNGLIGRVFELSSNVLPD